MFVLSIEIEQKYYWSNLIFYAENTDASVKKKDGKMI